MMKRSPFESDSGGPGVEVRPVWIVSYPGRCRYQPFWDLQKRIWRARYEGRIPDTLLFLEHEPVVTLGRNSRREHLLLSESGFRERGVDLVEVDRGGDVTYHGPGQLIGYWIFDLRSWVQDVHLYLREIEEVLIRTLGRMKIEAGRSPGATGVWVGDEKIAAIGMHLSHWVSTHGFAFNLDPDLTPFEWIVPCGLEGKGVTSVARLAGAGAPRIDRNKVETAVIEEMAGRFRRKPLRITPEKLNRALEGESDRLRPDPTRGSSERNRACIG